VSTPQVNIAFRYFTRCTLAAIALVAVTACGGGGSTPPPPPPLRPATTISVAVSGLAGQGLELALEDFVSTYQGVRPRTVETLGIDRNGHFVFAIPRPDAISYRIVAQLQPYSPAQRCVVRNGSFWTTNANIPDVEIVCGEYSYVVNGADNTISAFSVDSTTGAITLVGPPVSAGVTPSAIAGTSDKKYLYSVNSGSNNVSAFAVDPGTGALTRVPETAIVAGTTPRALALYNGTNNGFLYVANTGSDNLSAYQIDQSTGVPSPLSPASYTTGAGPRAIAILPASPPLIYAPPLLYVANTGGSHDISAFTINAATGDLTPIAGSPFVSGSSVTSLAFGAEGAFLYAADANGSTAAIFGFLVDRLSGALSPLSGSPLALPLCNDVVTDQTGTYLYATTGTDLLGYSIDALTGTLTLLPGFPIAVGADVRSVSIDPTNQFLYVANGSAGTVTSYTLNAVTGALTLMPGSPFAVGTAADYIATF
jgi:6-phosphogluconolactonase (cycloisomerase 2 family)